jgi:hypothetical membrane protein
MQSSPLLPLVGLLLMTANILLAALRPYRAPTAMGIQVFVGGMVTLTVAVVSLINPLGFAELERVVLFVSGCINCAVGYYMALLEMRRG